ncbi:unnamed protein product [Pleuronectes platessa]|uniref:Uncharacterized protein n=1 Tax=Pleuronectes platessa TaxID=8262 RepID=A0A9N7VZ85_PLEPL|nr:unnamed protein product [Pleuronectes platessa]
MGSVRGPPLSVPPSLTETHAALGPGLSSVRSPDIIQRGGDGNSDDLNTLPHHLHSDLLNALILCLVNLISIFQQVDEWLSAACDSHVFPSVKHLLVNTHRTSSSEPSDFNLEEWSDRDRRHTSGNGRSQWSGPTCRDQGALSACLSAAGMLVEGKDPAETTLRCTVS